MNSVCRLFASSSRQPAETAPGTPLTLIQGPITDALASLPDSKSKEYLKLAARNVSRLSRLVDSLMDFSKLAANKLEGSHCHALHHVMAFCMRLMKRKRSIGRFKHIPLGEYTADLASLFRR